VASTAGVLAASAIANATHKRRGSEDRKESQRGRKGAGNCVKKGNVSHRRVVVKTPGRKPREFPAAGTSLGGESKGNE